MARLNNRQQRFVDEYMVDFNATQAAIRAGYSVKTAGKIGSENLKKPDISRAVEKRRAELSRRTGISVERVLALQQKKQQRKPRSRPRKRKSTGTRSGRNTWPETPHTNPWLKNTKFP